MKGGKSNMNYCKCKEPLVIGDNRCFKDKFCSKCGEQIYDFTLIVYKDIEDVLEEKEE